MPSSVLFDLTEGMATVTLNRPESANAVDGSMRAELKEIWNDVRRNPEIRGVVVIGAGKRHFCTGRDMKWQVTLDDAARDGEDPFADFYDILDKPIVTAINGVCAGGGFHFIWQSDFAIAADSATFIEPHISVSRIPNREMLGLAARAVPLAVLLRMALLGKTERISAEQALMWGIVTELVPQEQLLGRAQELMATIIQNSPDAIATTKRILHTAFGLEYAHKGSLAFASGLARRVNRSKNAEEGARAFAERRAANWK
jgi:E-phenylitaconyl-CoA hydratase